MEEIKAKIAELRARFGRLKNICGLSTINRDTVEEYAKKIRELESQLKGGGRK